MRYNKIIYLLLPVLALISSCNEDVKKGVAEGYVDLKVVQDFSVEVVPVTKAAEGEGLPIALKIVDSEGNIDYESKDFTKVTTPIRLNTGRYTATAVAGTEMTGEVAELPFYSGSVTFEVKPNAVSTVELACPMRSRLTFTILLRSPTEMLPYFSITMPSLTTRSITSVLPESCRGK